MSAGTIDWITDVVVAAIQRGDTIAAEALRFLLRRYCATDRADLRDTLEPGLANGLRCQAAAETTDERAAWLTLFSEAAAISDDDRLLAAGVDLIGALRREWGRTSDVGMGAASVDACLLAGSHMLDPQSIVPDAIDELERIVAAAYRPGSGLARSVNDPDGVRGALADHVRTSSALLTAYDFSGRLPYPMLAEELMQFARQTLWDDRGGGFEQQPGADAKPFALNCEAARVLCRLAVLHDTPEYSRAAVVAPGADYRQDAARTLTSLEPLYREHGAKAAIYGLALGEWLGLR